MRFTIETVLDRPRDEVWRAFGHPENRAKWLPTLQAFEPVSGTPGRPGAVSRLTFREAGRLFVLTETITGVIEPNRFAGTYEADQAVNLAESAFDDLGDGRTRWVIASDFRFKGLFAFLAPAFGGFIERRLRDDCDRFKARLEAGDLVT